MKLKNVPHVSAYVKVCAKFAPILSSSVTDPDPYPSIIKQK
jgi:hypothetical protein